MTVRIDEHGCLIVGNYALPVEYIEDAWQGVPE